MMSTIPPKRYTPYYCVSTQKQGASVLGLEAQQAAVHAFAPGPAQLLPEYVKGESGKNNHLAIFYLCAWPKCDFWTKLLTKAGYTAKPSH